MGEKLELPELRQLAELEAVIEMGLATFVEVGHALLEIRDSRLYRESHRTFEQYCRERWGMSRSHAYRMIDAATVATAVSPMGDIPNERQARELVPLKDDEEAMVSTYREAKKLAEAERVEVSAELIGKLVRNRVNRAGREKRIAETNEQREQEARRSVSSVPLELATCSIEHWEPLVTPSAIVTDPPYVGDSLPLYELLRDFAVRSLPETGALVVMTWQAILPGVIRALEHPRLEYRWCVSWRYAGNERTQDHARRVFDCWKPILVYHLDGYPSDVRVVYDEIANPDIDKSHHEWGQGLEGFTRLVEAFTEPGEVVCDPFMGAGTTGLAALSKARQFVGCDIDAAAVETATRRLVRES